MCSNVDIHLSLVDTLLSYIEGHVSADTDMSVRDRDVYQTWMSVSLRDRYVRHRYLKTDLRHRYLNTDMFVSQSMITVTGPVGP